MSNRNFLTIPEQHFEAVKALEVSCGKCDLRGAACLQYPDETGCKTGGGNHIFYKLIQNNKPDETKN